jgi:hypothetical protein
MGVADLDAVLVESVGDVEVTRIEDELHRKGAGRHVTT